MNAPERASPPGPATKKRKATTESRQGIKRLKRVKPFPSTPSPTTPEEAEIVDSSSDEEEDIEVQGTAKLASSLITATQLQKRPPRRGKNRNRRLPVPDIDIVLWVPDNPDQSSGIWKDIADGSDVPSDLGQSMLKIFNGAYRKPKQEKSYGVIVRNPDRIMRLECCVNRAIINK